MREWRCFDCVERKTYYGDVVVLLGRTPLCQRCWNARMEELGRLISRALELCGMLRSPESEEMHDALYEAMPDPQ